jgi:calcium channel MID1
VQTNSDIFIGIEAPLLTDGWAGSWHYEIAASTDGYYHSYHEDETFLFMVDTDSESALFITPNITSANDTAEIKKWSDMDPLPFVIYTQPTAKWGPMTGLERSYCALETAMNETGNITVKSTITTNFGDAERNLAKAQFHVQGLMNGTAYQGFLAINGTADGLEIPGVGIVRNGGQVWRQFNWTTKAGKHNILLLRFSTILIVRQTTPVK